MSDHIDTTLAKIILSKVQITWWCNECKFHVPPVAKGLNVICPYCGNLLNIQEGP